MTMRIMVFVVLGSVAPALVAAQESRDSIRAERQRHVEALRERIAGREQQPAGEVFRDIRMLKEMPAGRLLSILVAGYASSLGVGCDHCLVVGELEIVSKPQKQFALDLAAMAGRINRELLPAIGNLDSERPVVNCTTCHRGQVKPATSLDR
jgi:hypothetical protein